MFEQITADDRDWRWLPSDLLMLPRNWLIVGGMFGGIYLIEHQSSGAFRLAVLDDRPSSPVEF
jgi:hypothetical protein